MLSLTDSATEVLAKLRDHHPSADLEAVGRAYELACSSHEGQSRRSGEPYIVHPVAVAAICADLGLDATAVIAALLHDVVEDTEVGLDEIRAGFGEQVAEIVDGVTKLTRIDFVSAEQRQAENYRKLVVAMARDLRVLLVKLADRLHNMRTISHHPRPKQIQKARETLDIYAPLAHRLGIHSWKWELEDLSFAVVLPTRYHEIEAMVAQRRSDRESDIDIAAAELSLSLSDSGISPVQISGRAKHFYSIYQKMASRGMEFNEVYDLTALRVVCSDVRDCYGTIGVVHSLYRPLPGRFKDYIAMPKANGYRSLHTTVVGLSNAPLEIQVRTVEMHAEAEYGIAAHWRYKGRSDAPEEWARRLADWQSQTPDSETFLSDLRADLSSDEVFAFTPKGDIVTMRAGATPIDFAYEIHTEVGHHCVGAKVGGRIVPLTYTIASGDIVEILTSKNSPGPSRDWLSIAKSPRALTKIRHVYRQRERDDAEQEGRERLTQDLRRAGLTPARLAEGGQFTAVMEEMGYRRLEDLQAAIGSGKVSASVVTRKILNHLRGADPRAAHAGPAHASPRARRRSPGSEMGVLVDGAQDVLTRMARCCNPLPGDQIVGYVSLGRGVTVHRADCANAQALARRGEQRICPVAWEGAPRRGFVAEIAITGWDRTRLLENISATISGHGANILSGYVRTTNGMVKNAFSVEVPDAPSVMRLIGAIAALEGVVDCHRIEPKKKR